MAFEIKRDKDGFLNWSEGVLVSSEEINDTGRDVGSIWEAISPGDTIKCSDGLFRVDEDCDLQKVSDSHA